MAGLSRSAHGYRDGRNAARARGRNASSGGRAIRSIPVRCPAPPRRTNRPAPFQNFPRGERPRRKASKPKPGSSGSARASSFSRNSRSRDFAGRASGARFLRAGGEQNRRRGKIRLRKRGRPAPASPADCAVSSIKSRKAVSMDSRCARGSTKCRSTMQSGGGRKGLIAHVFAAEQPLDFPGKIAAETRGEKTRRARRHIAERLQSSPAQGRASASSSASSAASGKARDGGSFVAGRKRRRRRKNAPARGRNPASPASGRARGKSERRHVPGRRAQRPCSPPNRWAQPVTSRTRPCGSSSAVSGV